MNTADTVAEAFQSLWFGLVQFIPELVVALVIFLVGWAVGAVVAQGVRSLARSLHLDSTLDRIGFNKLSERTGWNFRAGNLLAEIVKWFFIIVFLIAALDVLGLTQIILFLQEVAFSFLPNLIVATLMVILGALIADMLDGVVEGAARSAGVDGARFLGAITRWAIWIFAGLAALYQIGVATALVQMLFGGVVFALALALGLSFGLGGREHANRYLEKMKKNLRD